MADKTAYLRVRNWERFQHYKDRRPPWIKYHVELLDDYELTHMDYESQLVYDRLLLLAARTDNNIPNDPEHIARHISVKSEVVNAAIENLLLAGFLTIATRKRAASKAIAGRKQDADSETEQNRETESESTETETETDAASAVVRQFGLSLSDEIDFELQKILKRCRGADANSIKSLRKAAEGKTLAEVVSVRDAVEKKGGSVGVGYAVNGLKNARAA